MTEERLNRIRDKHLAEQGALPNRDLLQMRGWAKYKNVTPHNVLHASVDALVLDGLPTFIDAEDDLLLGRHPRGASLTAAEQAEAAELRPQWDAKGAMNGMNNAATGHRVIDYEKLLALGIEGVLREIEAREAEIDFYDPEAAQKRAFYRAGRIILEAVVRYQKRYEAACRDLAARTQDAARRAELKRMAEAIARVPEKPAATFYEGIQSVWFLQYILAVLGDISLTGRPADYLFNLYRADVERGALEPETAMSLIEDLYFKHNMVYGAWPGSIMVGGVNRQGEPVWNELSYMLIRAIGTTKLVNPSVAICYNEAMPDDLLDLCVDLLAKGYTRPSIFNDELIIRGLLDAGASEEDARYYIHSTCVEITPIGASDIQVATPYINLNKGLEYLFNGGKRICGEEGKYGCDFPLWKPVSFDLSQLTDFEAFFRTVREIVKNIIASSLARIQDYAYNRVQYASTPLSSCFLNDCLEKGKEAVAGGARYHFVYPCFPGFSNLADSVAAVKKAVYEDKIVSLEELGDAMRADFAQQGRLRAFLMNRCPKFGNDLPEADEIAASLYELIRSELKKYRIANGGAFHASYFAWIMHGVLGEQGGATPDGRKAREAFSECLGAVQGMDKNGPMALLRSVAKIEQMYSIGGVATNFRFSKAFMRENARGVREFIKEFMRADNFECQFNVVDQETLRDAQKHPENYRTLLVRVAGYSEYFVNLPPVLQNEVMKRLEHDGL